MAVSYPSSSAEFTTKVDNVDNVMADHVNKLQGEVKAIQDTIGTNPQISGLMSGGSFNLTPSTNYSTLTARVANVEAGLYKSINTNYVSIAGASTITASAPSIKGLVIKGATSQTANLQEWQSPAGTVNSYVDKDGYIVNPKTEADLNNLYVLSVVFG